MEWRDVVGFEGLYKVSDEGGIYSFKSNKILKPRNLTNGYLGYALRKDNRYYQLTAHRIVATAFLPNPNNLADVHHKDEDKSNNTATNLAWCAHMENVTLSKGKAVVRSDGKLYATAAEAARDLYCEASHITACCKGRKGYKTVRGFTWQYKGAEPNVTEEGKS